MTATQRSSQKPGAMTKPRMASRKTLLSPIPRLRLRLRYQEPLPYPSLHLPPPSIPEGSHPWPDPTLRYPRLDSFLPTSLAPLD